MAMIDWVGQVGGFLGLCLGFSICSLVEFVYWLGFRLWWGCKLKTKEMP